MLENSEIVTPIGHTNWRNENRPFGIKLQDRYRHLLILGSTGVGKSYLMTKMAEHDMQSGLGLCYVEPHGDGCLALLQRVPAHREKDLVYFDPTNPAHRTGFNPLHGVPSEQHHLVASEIVEAFKKIWFPNGDAPRTEHILRYCILTLLGYPAATLCDITAILLDRAFRNLVLHYVEDPVIHGFWNGEFDRYSPRLQSEAIAPILNKAGIFNANAVLREVVCQQHGIDIGQIMDEGKILIVNLSKGLIGNDVSLILGSLIVTGIQTAALRRAAIPEHQRRGFMVYIDESQTMISTSFSEMLSQIRKYRVSLTLATQSLLSLPQDVQHSLMANCGSVIAYRCGSADAKLLSVEFFPTFTQADFMSLPRLYCYVKLSICGTVSKPFSAQTNLI